MDIKKAKNYKKLVHDMQEKYPKYDFDFSKGATIRPSEEAKQKSRDFAKTFSDKKEFWQTLKDMGFKWRGQDSTDLKVVDMWAHNALSAAIDRGFNPNDKLPLWAPYVKLDGKMVCVCNEINLYTYWQGFNYAEKTPKIKYLLVAQDWGNPFGQPPMQGLKKFFDMNATKKWISPYDKLPQSVNLNTNLNQLFKDYGYGLGTDTNLVELFKILGYNILQPNEDLFFTNFCLGYRSGKTSGDMTAKLMMNDAAEFKRLCDILEPENILCLGRHTFECAYEALTGNKYNAVDNNYNHIIENHADIIVRCGGVDSKIYPLAHCGGMGTGNRNSGLPKQSDPLYYQKQDWAKIANNK